MLALIALVQFAYPITAYGAMALIVYEIFYASMILVGFIVGRDSQRHMVFLPGSYRDGSKAGGAVKWQQVV